MKELFPGHFKDDEESVKALWNTSIFVLDTNVLLNLYRYSDNTRQELFSFLEKIQKRLWIPNWVASEYFNQRLTVIGKQEDFYDEAISKVKSLKEELENERRHPFIKDQTMQKATEMFDELCNELNDSKLIHTNRINADNIKDDISVLFEKRVGGPYNKEKIEEILSEGEERYSQKIPPGYKDGAKFEKSKIYTERCRKFGDLIIWYQIIDKSLNDKVGVIFITDDKKEDWWELFKGKTIGPRPELIKEFKDKTCQSFYMYQVDHFLQKAKSILDTDISHESVEEIRAVRDRANNMFDFVRQLVVETQADENDEHTNRKRREYGESLNPLYQQLLQNRMNDLQKKIDELTARIDWLYRQSEEDDDKNPSLLEYLADLEYELDNLFMEQELIRQNGYMKS